jgi:hypothetical protein
VSPAHREFIEFSQSTQTQTRYIMELFNVELSPEAHPGVENNPANRWLSAAEIEAGRTQDAQPVSATMKRLLGEIDRET